MNIPSHSTLVKDKMQQLANVTTQAVTRITEQILSNAANALRDSIGSSGYKEYLDKLNAYMSVVEIPPVGEEGKPTESLVYDEFDSKNYGDLTDDEKSLRNLIYAEAYFGLYYLSIALRKLVKGNVNTSREGAAGLSVAVPSFDDLIGNMELYRDQALMCISSALGSSDGFFDGQMVVFVV